MEQLQCMSHQPPELIGCRPYIASSEGDSHYLHQIHDACSRGTTGWDPLAVLVPSWEVEG
ncbi:hypothetical protein EWB00_000350 [Schistosoma japonicum]|uniref:Uncharacterized protein n=1 Tax=Schistosoma japonicum TaxID=6182 RepID=A0A4Z2CKI5_SCHJA|nr:hypothetical protein EWB00_000350 [Schistosoma japonicum]